MFESGNITHYYRLIEGLDRYYVRTKAVGYRPNLSPFRKPLYTTFETLVSTISANRLITLLTHKF